MNINTLFPSKYVKAVDLGDKVVTVTIRDMTVEKLGFGNEQESKPVLWFANATKGLVLNRTNAMIIASLYTPETDNWKGKQISLYAARVKAFGAWHDAVRVKEQIPARNVTPSRMPEAMQEAAPIEDEEDVLDVDEGNPLAANNDDSMWEPEPDTYSASIAPRATEEQLARLNELGETYYSAQWQQVKERNVKRISAGKAQKAGDLTPDQIQKLIDGIVGLMSSKATNGVAK